MAPPASSTRRFSVHIFGVGFTGGVLWVGGGPVAVAEGHALPSLWVERERGLSRGREVGGAEPPPRKKKKIRRAAEGGGRRPEGGRCSRSNPFEEKSTPRTKGEGRGKGREAEGRYEKMIGKRGAGLRTWRLTARMTHIRWGRLVSIAAVLSSLIRFVCFCFFFCGCRTKKRKCEQD